MGAEIAGTPCPAAAADAAAVIALWQACGLTRPWNAPATDFAPALAREENVAAPGFYETVGLERQDVVVLGRFLKRRSEDVTILYGIPNCDTVKKARTWLGEYDVPYAFHNYKTGGVPEAALRGWVDRLGWEALLNRTGTTFRALPDADKTGLDADKAIAIMLANPSTIKRPVLESGDVLLAGFKPDTYLDALKP